MVVLDLGVVGIAGGFSLMSCFWPVLHLLHISLNCSSEIRLVVLIRSVSSAASEHLVVLRLRVVGFEFLVFELRCQNISL